MLHQAINPLPLTDLARSQRNLIGENCFSSKNLLQNTDSVILFGLRIIFCHHFASYLMYLEMRISRSCLNYLTPIACQFWLTLVMWKDIHLLICRIAMLPLIVSLEESLDLTTGAVSDLFVIFFILSQSTLFSKRHRTVFWSLANLTLTQ